MTSRKDRRTGEAILSLQEPTGALATRLAKRASRAQKRLADLLLLILADYTEQGMSGRRARAEFLRRPVSEAGLVAMREEARKIKDEAVRMRLMESMEQSPVPEMTVSRAISKACVIESHVLRQEVRPSFQSVVSMTVEEATLRTEYDVQTSVGFAVRFDMPNQRAIDKLATDSGVWIKAAGFADGRMDAVKEVIRDQMVEGIDPEETAERISDLTGRNISVSRTVARTTVADLSNQAMADEMRELGAERFEVRCALDERTCPICSRMDRQVYDMGSEKPPYHPNCRCITAVHRDERLDTSLRERAARDSNGRTISVPYDTTYEQWVQRYGSEKAQARFAKASEVPEPPHRRVSRR